MGKVKTFKDVSETRLNVSFQLVFQHHYDQSASDNV